MAAPPRSVIGEGFKEYVGNQVKTRQSYLKIDERDNNSLRYITSKTSYASLYSSIYIEPNSPASKSLQDIPDPSNRLAYALTTVNSSHFPSGISYDQSSNPAYGYLATTDSGYIPFPGITSVDIRSLNRGSLREATIKIVCHNLKQFRIIDALYLKLKYTMLLEWGHTNWLNNNKELQNSFSTNSHLLDGNYDVAFILDSIEKTRESSCGNYDGFLGQVKNFDWTLRNDGGYDITLNLISSGDVIDSLKINVNYPNLSPAATPPYTTPAAGETPPVLPTVIANKNKSTLNQILYALYQHISQYGIKGNSPRNTPFWLNGVDLTADKIKNYTYTYSNYFLGINYISKDEQDNPSVESDYLTGQEGLAVWQDYLSVDEDGDVTGGFLTYIKLGTLLRIIETFLLKYDTSHAGTPPIIHIDYNYNENLCLTLPEQFSIDPRIAMLKPEALRSRGINFYGKAAYEDMGDNFRVPKRKFVGKFMHIHVNIDHISVVLERNIDDEGKVSLYDFLTDLMKDIQTATGCINDFEVTYDDVTNYLVIRDNTTTPGNVDLLKRNKTVTRFNTHLLNNAEGSFVLDTALKSELNNVFSSTVSIGAQVNGNQVGENSTFLSNLNEGYRDMIFPNKSSETDISIANRDSNSVYVDTLDNLINTVSKISIGKITSDEINNNKNAAVDYYKYKLGNLTKKIETGGGEFPGVGIIPLNLKLTMDGLSGMRIYESYIIDDQVLPPLYKNKIQFIIKGLNHSISNNSWTTTIESMSIPRQPDIGYEVDPVATTPPPQTTTPPPNLSITTERWIADSRYLYYASSNTAKGVHLLFAGNDSTTNARGSWTNKYINQIPWGALQDIIFVITDYQNSISNAKQFIQDTFSRDITSIAGFSAGGKKAWAVADDSTYTLVGLIDPSTYNSYIKPFGANTYLHTRPDNWGSYPTIKNSLNSICAKKNDPEYAGHVTCTSGGSYDHYNHIKYFYDLYYNLLPVN